MTKDNRQYTVNAEKNKIFNYSETKCACNTECYSKVVTPLLNAHESMNFSYKSYADFVKSNLKYRAQHTYIINEKSKLQKSKLQKHKQNKSQPQS